MNRILVTVAVACIARAAVAQPASAIGKWLPDSSMPASTVVVRVIAGAPQAPVVGTEVTLVVAGQPRQARTDSSGRATFPALPAGATIQAKIVDAENKEQQSEAASVPASGGARVMLSTKPFTGTMPAAAGGQGMPEARQMSGQPRPDRGVPGGSYQIRVTYNNVTMANGGPTDVAPPVGEVVNLIGYASDDTIQLRTAKTGPDGYVQFDGLDVTGNTSYIALTRLPRAGAADRLMTGPVQPESGAGLKAILSSEKRDSTASPIDDLADPQTLKTPPGKVRVTLDGFATEAAEITLIDAATKAVVGRGIPAQGKPDPSNVQGQAQFHAEKALPKGTLAIKIHGGAGNDDQPVPDVPIRVVPAGQEQQAEGIASQTGPDGTVQVTVPVGKEYKVVFTINGREMVSAAFDLSPSGGRLDVKASWEAVGRPEVVLDVPYQPDQVLYAQTTMRPPEDQTPGARQLYRSPPFVLLEHAGTHVGILVYPRILLRFSLRAFVEDELLAVRGQFIVENHSWSPFRASADGLVVPLPKGFKGAGVADENQAEVAVAAGEGLRVLRPLPAMARKTFIAGFSLASDGGEIKWALDLPLGTYASGMEIKHSAGMQVNASGNTPAELVTARDGSQWFVVDGISIRPKQSMVMTITGLPAAPGWKLWAPRVIGVMVLLTMLAGIAYALRGRPIVAADTTARRNALLDELVELDKSGKDPLRRERVIAELEKLWR